jgi:hypothetical protein
MLDSSRAKTLLMLLSFIFLFVCSASSLFAQNKFLPTIEDTLCPSEWLYAGPFSVGAREGVVGVIEDL